MRTTTEIETQIRKAFTNGCRAKIRAAWDGERAHRDPNVKAHFAGSASGWEDANCALRNAEGPLGPKQALNDIAKLTWQAEEELVLATEEVERLELTGPATERVDYAEARWEALEDAHGKLATHIRVAPSI